MKFPRMTPKRWFWSAMAAGFLWTMAGWRWDGLQHSWMAGLQNGLSQPPELAAVPPSFIFTTVQASAQNGMRSLAGTGGLSGTPAEIDARNQALQNENTQLKAILAEMMARQQALGYLKLANIQPEDVLAATVIGYQAGPGASLLRLDKGALQGVKENAVVVAPLEQVHLLGRVVHVGQAECEVRLVTDPLMKTQGQIIRPVLLPPGSPSPAQNQAVTNDMCLLEGLGNGTMKIDNVDKQPADPKAGDLVCLTDGRWPAKVQHMVLGQVESVGIRTDQPGRYAIRVVPRITVSAQRTVMILIRE